MGSKHGKVCKKSSPKPAETGHSWKVSLKVHQIFGYWILKLYGFMKYEMGMFFKNLKLCVMFFF
jgi:hypothetical protein